MVLGGYRAHTKRGNDTCSEHIASEYSVAQEYVHLEDRYTRKLHLQRAQGLPWIRHGRYEPPNIELDHMASKGHAGRCCHGDRLDS